MGPKEEAAPASMEENTLACVGSVMLLLVKNDTLCNWFLKKKKEREKTPPCSARAYGSIVRSGPKSFLVQPPSVFS